MKGRKGLPVYVLRNARHPGYEGQFTRAYDQAVLLGGVDLPGFKTGEELGQFEPTVESPALVLVRRKLFGREANYAVPLSLFGPDGTTGAAGHVTFGGNYVTTSDSRFRSATGVDALPVHDHVVSWEQSARMVD